VGKAEAVTGEMVFSVVFSVVSIIAVLLCWGAVCRQDRRQRNRMAPIINPIDIEPPARFATPPADPPRGWGTLVHVTGEPPATAAVMTPPGRPLYVRQLPYLIEACVRERGGLDDEVTYLQWEVGPGALELRIRTGPPS
jgi:hypothetical protein